MGIIDTCKSLAWKGVDYLAEKEPTILLVGGLIGTGVAVVGLCKATIECQEPMGSTLEYLANKRNEMKTIEEEEKANPELKDPESKALIRNEMMRTYKQTAVLAVKKYGPWVALLATSMGCIGLSHVRMAERISALGAAYTLLSQDFNNYRTNVINDAGEEADKRYKAKYTPVSVETTEITEDGEVIKGDVMEVKFEPSGLDFVFDSSHPWWRTKENGDGDTVENERLLRHTILELNHQLRTRGVIGYNDIMNALMLTKKKAGIAVGRHWDYSVEDQSLPQLKISFTEVDNGRDEIICSLNCDQNILGAYA
jgi:hypothetical protein